MRHLHNVLAAASYAQLMAAAYMQEFRFFLGGAITGAAAFFLLLYKAERSGW